MTIQLLPGCTGVLALADGTILQGIGVGATGAALGEVVFNTAMTGYQEILTDPSYMSQILAFTFPHVGNVGVNVEDIEQIGGGSDTSAKGAIFRDVPTDPANYRAESDFDGWMGAGVPSYLCTTCGPRAGVARCASAAALSSLSFNLLSTNSVRSWSVFPIHSETSTITPPLSNCNSSPSWSISPSLQCVSPT